MKCFLIGDKVYVPKFKVIGTILDKKFEIDQDEIIVIVRPDVEQTTNTYRPSFQDNSPLYRNVNVKYSNLKSMESIDLYKNKLIETTEIVDLKIPNLLKKRDFIKGTEVLVVDNYMLERIKTYPQNCHLYSALLLSHLLGRKGILTGQIMNLSNGEFAVECEYNVGTYYTYAHSLQLLKGVNIFKRFWNCKLIKKIRKNPFLTLMTVYFITFVIVTIIILIIKH